MDSAFPFNQSLPSRSIYRNNFIEKEQINKATDTRKITPGTNKLVAEISYFRNL